MWQFIDKFIEEVKFEEEEEEEEEEETAKVRELR